jgi:hypothetical protein
MELETGIVDLYSFFVVSATIRGILGVVMKKKFHCRGCGMWRSWREMTISIGIKQF